MIVGMVGFLGSGKDTVANILCQQGYKRESFAKPLKDAVANIFNWNRELLEGSTSESRAWREIPDKFWSDRFERPFTPREALQLMGTEAGRNVFHPNIWVDALVKRVSDSPGDYIITDVRFKNEIALIQGIGGLVVRIKRGPEPSWFAEAANYNFDCLLANQDLAIGPDKAIYKVHQSERDWIGSPLIEYEIDNNGTLHDLEQNVFKLLEFVKSTNFG